VQVILFAIIASLFVSANASAQPPANCKPNALNIPGAPYPCISPDRRVTFRVAAPDAQKVRVRLGPGFDMNKGPDGLWYATIPPQVVGFHYYTLSIDGGVVADPATAYLLWLRFR
jgi:enterochelin esterase family protein